MSNAKSTRELALWEYRARVDRIVDGDTVDVVLDLGFNVQKRIRLRLKGVDTAETWGVSKESEEFERGTKHKMFVEDWVLAARERTDSEWPFIVQTSKDGKGKYGRWIADLRPRGSQATLCEGLVSEYGDEVVQNYD